MADEKKAVDSKPAFSPISDLYRRVDEVLDRIRPYVQLDGGHVELVDVNEEDGVVHIRFQGSCQGCPSSAMTLQMGIENELKTSIPEIKQVVAV
jgi:Fe-S cluster biogenesis protein NfuA